MGKVEIRGYIDPRTGEYKRTTEDADERQVAEDLGFIFAWKFYWDGPQATDKTYLYEREAWLTSDAREAWLADLTEEQRTLLSEALPPEELLDVGEG